MDSYNPFEFLDDSDHFNDVMETVYDGEGMPINNQDNIPTVLYNLSDSDSYDENPHVATDANEEAVRLTDLKNLKTVISVSTNYNGGNLTNYLKQIPGLIILPLSAVSMIRKPSGGHTYNPVVLTYIPKGPAENYSHLGNFNNAINCIYSCTK